MTNSACHALASSATARPTRQSPHQKCSVHTVRRYATPRLDWSFIWELMTLQSRCSVCGKQCLSRIGLSSHSKTHKIKSSPKVFCPHCEKVCNSKIGLWNHLRTHDSNRADAQCVWQTVPVTRIGLFSHSKTHKIKSSPKVFCLTLWEGMQLQDWTVKSSIC